METFILAVSSPLVLAAVFFVFIVIAIAVRLSALNYSVLSIVYHAASGMGAVYFLLLGSTLLVDFSLTCRILLNDTLLQFEFIVVTFIALAWLIEQYIRNFDPPYDPGEDRRNPGRPK